MFVVHITFTKTKSLYLPWIQCQLRNNIHGRRGYNAHLLSYFILSNTHNYIKLRLLFYLISVTKYLQCESRTYSTVFEFSGSPGARDYQKKCRTTKYPIDGSPADYQNLNEWLKSQLRDIPTIQLCVKISEFPYDLR